MRGLVSFSLFGKDPDGIYREGALKNAQMYSTLYQGTNGVISRFYVSQGALKWATENLSGLPGVEIIQMRGHPEDQSATMWRFLSLKERSYDFFLFRDTDSRPIPREVAAVTEWLESPRQFHVIRDHPYHCVPMLAGLWGVKAKGALNIHKKFPAPMRRAYYQMDQVYLKALIWPYAKNDVLAHVDCQWTYGEHDIRPFPLEGDPSEGFCGEGLYGDDRPRFPEHARSLVG